MADKADGRGDFEIQLQRGKPDRRDYTECGV
jgi:hypothetical protein